jgi:hypothetical protein
MKCQLRALAVAGALFASLTAPAGAAVLNQPLDTVSIGTISPPGFAPIGGTAAQPGPFTDYFNFTIATPLSFTASATATATPSSSGPGTPSVSGFSLALLNGSGPAPGSVVEIDATPTNDNGSLHAALLSALLLSPGNYTVRLMGTALANGANLGGAIALIAPTPVPIPGALLLFGSGLVGLCALTRKRRQKAVPITA